MLKIKVLSSNLLALKTLRIGSLGLSYFPFIYLCVNLLRQGAEMDHQQQKMNLTQLYHLTQFYIQFFVLKKLIKPSSKVSEIIKKISPIAVKTAQNRIPLPKCGLQINWTVFIVIQANVGGLVHNTKQPTVGYTPTVSTYCR